MKFRITLIFLLFFSLTACGSGEKTIRWKQEVQLQDGRVIEVNRISKQTGHVFPENVILEYEQTLSFTNPDTQEKITWKIPKGLMPRMIDFDQKIPYILFAVGSVADYNTWNCPNPPHIIFRYTNHQWQQIALAQLPTRFTKPNTLYAASSDNRASRDGLVTIAEMQKYLIHDIPKWRLEEFSTLSRKKIHPIAKDCSPDILIKQGRESEINVPYYNDAGVLITPKAE